MENAEILKNARNVLLKLHKSLIDHERELYEGIHGPQSPGQFLNVLLEDEDFSWLRKFSMLIVEIDEMFDLKDGISSELVDANLSKIRELMDMKEDDEFFRAKYQFALQRFPEVVGLQSELRQIISAVS